MDAGQTGPCAKEAAPPAAYVDAGTIEDFIEDELLSAAAARPVVQALGGELEGSALEDEVERLLSVGSRSERIAVMHERPFQE